jgi:hypothetical protein
MKAINGMEFDHRIYQVSGFGESGNAGYSLPAPGMHG